MTQHEFEFKRQANFRALFALDEPPDHGRIERHELMIWHDQRRQVYSWECAASSKSFLSVLLTIETSSETLFIEWD